MSLALPTSTTVDPAILAQLQARVDADPADVAQTALIAQAWTAAQQQVEAYLDRKLDAGDYTDTITHSANAVYSLQAYPVTVIASVEDESGRSLDGQYHADMASGLLMFERPCPAHQIVIKYTANPTFTGQMFAAMLSAFDVHWGVFSGESLSDEVKSTAIDGMSVSYAQGSTASLAATAGLPENVAAMLAPYRRVTC